VRNGRESPTLGFGNLNGGRNHARDLRRGDWNFGSMIEEASADLRGIQLLVPHNAATISLICRVT